MNKITVCTKCIMDNTAEEIVFDSSGVCNYCHDYDKKIKSELHYDNGQAQLENLAGEIRRKGRGKEYDCLIGLSGGVDSTYVAYLVRKKFGLRPLAVHLDNGWNSELSVANIEQITKRLEIDLYTHVLDWEKFKDIQLSFLKSSISNIEMPTDHAIWSVMLHTAAKRKIQYIISGHNLVTEAIMPDSWIYTSKEAKIIKSIQERFGKYDLSFYPTLTTFNYIDYLLIRRIKWIPILNYYPYSKKEAKEIITQELGWRDYGGKHYESIFTRFFHAYYLPEKFGYDLRKPYLSALINSGQMTREEALAEIAGPTAPADQLARDREYVIKKLELSDVEFEKIIKQQNKTFADYPNNYRLWKKMSWFVQKARSLSTRVS